MPHESPWLTRREAADDLRVDVRTLERWAQVGDGPPYHPIRRRMVRYHRAELDAWAQRETRLHTADDGAAAQVLAEAEQIARRRPTP